MTPPESFSTGTCNLYEYMLREDKKVPKDAPVKTIRTFLKQSDSVLRSLAKLPLTPKYRDKCTRILTQYKCFHLDDRMRLYVALN